LHQVGAFVVCERATFHAREEVREREAVDVFHNEVRVCAVHLEVVHGDDVGVRQHAGRAGLCKRLAYGRRRRPAALAHEGDPLDGHPALQARVPAGEDGAKAARLAGLHDPVAAQQKRLPGLRLGGSRLMLQEVLVPHDAILVRLSCVCWRDEVSRHEHCTVEKEHICRDATHFSI
jgi:hypothetical protein